MVKKWLMALLSLLCSFSLHAAESKNEVETRTGRGYSCISIRHQMNADPTALLLLPSTRRVLAGFSNGVVGEFGIAEGLIRHKKVAERTIEKLVLSSEASKLVVVPFVEEVSVFDMQNMQKIASFSQESSTKHVVGIQGSNLLFVKDKADQGRKITSLDLKGFDSKEGPELAPGTVVSRLFNNGSSFFAVNPKSIQLWDAGTLTCIRECKSPEFKVDAVEPTGDGGKVVVSTKSQLILIETLSGNKIVEFDLSLTPAGYAVGNNILYVARSLNVPCSGDNTIGYLFRYNIRSEHYLHTLKEELDKQVKTQEPFISTTPQSYSVAACFSNEKIHIWKFGVDRLDTLAAAVCKKNMQQEEIEALPTIIRNKINQ